MRVLEGRRAKGTRSASKVPPAAAPEQEGSLASDLSIFAGSPSCEANSPKSEERLQYLYKDRVESGRMPYSDFKREEALHLA